MKATEFHHLTAMKSKKIHFTPSLTGWSPPPLNHYKINIDGAHDHATNFIIAGGSLRMIKGIGVVVFLSLWRKGDALLAEL